MQRLEQMELGKQALEAVVGAVQKYVEEVGLGTFRLFKNHSVSFKNEGLQLNRSILVPFLSFRSCSVPFHSE